MADLNEASFAAELQGIFLTETQEMLDATEAAFLEIEANPDDRARIDKIFRLLHTIKGSAHVAGFPQLGDFAHTFETLIAAIRDRRLGVTSEVVDLLLAGNDGLQGFVAALRNDRLATVSVATIEARVRATLAGAAPRHATSARVPAAASEAAATELQIAALERRPSAGVPAPPVGRGVERTVLICDDEPEILGILRTVLEDGGYQVASASDGEEALKVLSERVIDVVMTDLRMPGMNGIDLVRAIRKINHLIPVARFHDGEPRGFTVLSHRYLRTGGTRLS